MERLDVAERHLALLHDVARVLAEFPGLREAGPQLLQAIGARLGWALGCLWRVDEAAAMLRCLHSWQLFGGRRTAFEAESMARPLGFGIGLPGRVWKSGAPVSIADVTGDPNFPRSSLAAQEGLHGAVGFPIRVGKRVLGVMEFFSHNIQAPDADLLQVLSSVGSQVGQFMERKRAEEALRDSEARKAAILEASLDAIVTMDHEGRVVEFNGAAERMFGRRREDVLGAQMAELIVPPQLRPQHYAGLARYLATGQGPVLGQRLELSAVRADGVEFPVELTIVRIGTEGTPAFTGFIRDLSRQGR